MPRQNKQYRKRKVRLSNNVNFGIPQENILDLKKMVREREIEKSKEQSKQPWLKKLFTKSPKPAQELPKEPVAMAKKEAPSKKAKPAKKEVSKKSQSWWQETVEGFYLFQQKFMLPKGWKKTIGAFIFVAFLLVSPIYVAAYYQRANQIKGEVLGVTSGAYLHLESASKSAQEFDFNSAFSEFSLALDDFSKAQEELSQISSVVKIVPGKGSQFSSGQHLLAAGERFAEAGQYLTKAIGPLAELQAGEGEEKWTLVTALLLLDTNLSPAVEQVNRAAEHLEKVDLSDVPREQRDKIAAIQQGLPRMQGWLEEFSSVSHLATRILGGGEQKRYLLLFQDNSEIRPTGGFIGSFALVTFENGVVTELIVPPGGTYDLNGYLKEQVIAPAPLHLVNPHWYAQDANWYPDFSYSARKFMWFYEESGGPSVDGVMALTPDALETLLAAIGPVKMPEFGVTIDQDNVREVLLEEVAKVRETREPKRIISELVPEIINTSLEADVDNMIEVLSGFKDLLNQKHLLFYFSDPELQQGVEQRNWAGRIVETNQNYFFKVDTNIAGGKTDHLIDEVVKHESEISEDGKIVDTIEVIRSHRGDPTQEIENIKNMDFVRFYVPQGSELISAEGFTRVDPRLFIYPNAEYKEDEELEQIQGKVTIDEASGTRVNNEFGYTVFGNWLGIEAGKSATVKVVYELPFKLETSGFFEKTGSYSMVAQRQAGSFPQYYIHTVKFPQSWEVIWKYPESEQFKVENGALTMEGILKQDLVLAAVFKE